MDKPNQNQQGNQGQNQQGNQQNASKQAQGAGSTPQQAPLNMLQSAKTSQNGEKQKPAAASSSSQKSGVLGAQTGNHWNYTLIWIVLILVVIGAGWWIGGASYSEAPSEDSMTGSTSDDAVMKALDEAMTAEKTPSSTTPSVIQPISGVGNSVQVVDQTAGDSVLISSATLSRLGWIAVLDSRDWVLGAARFMGGQQTNVYVPLLRATESGQSYKAVIYLDDGDGQFDHKKDMRTDVSSSFAAN